MKIEMTQCDNPFCKIVDRPESYKPFRPPYGWIVLRGYMQGIMQNFTLVVCSIDCATEAVREEYCNQIAAKDR